MYCNKNEVQHANISGETSDDLEVVCMLRSHETSNIEFDFWVTKYNIYDVHEKNTVSTDDEVILSFESVKGKTYLFSA